MDLTETEVEVLRAISVIDSRTYGAARDRFVGSDTSTEALLGFRSAILSLLKKGLISVPEGDDVVLPPTTKFLITDAGWSWIDSSEASPQTNEHVNRA